MNIIRLKSKDYIEDSRIIKSYTKAHTLIMIESLLGVLSGILTYAWVISSYKSQGYNTAWYNNFLFVLAVSFVTLVPFMAACMTKTIVNLCCQDYVKQRILTGHNNETVPGYKYALQDIISLLSLGFMITLCVHPIIYIATVLGFPELNQYKIMFVEFIIFTIIPAFVYIKRRPLEVTYGTVIQDTYNPSVFRLAISMAKSLTVDAVNEINEINNDRREQNELKNKRK